MQTNADLEQESDNASCSPDAHPGPKAGRRVHGQRGRVSSLPLLAEGGEAAGGASRDPLDLQSQEEAVGRPDQVVPDAGAVERPGHALQRDLNSGSEIHCHC